MSLSLPHLLLCAVFWLCALSARAEAPSAAARAIFEQSRNAVVKVNSTLAGNINSSGSAFMVSSDGMLVTNYHVVSDHVFEPATYQLRYQTPDGREGPATLIAIDATNDLALIKSDLKGIAPLALNTTTPAKGETAYSMGFPLSQGITVTEGTFNGVSEAYYREQFHFTGAVNSGMSGGPALDRTGKVIGVNVARIGGAQLVSFLVPAHFVRELLDSALPLTTAPQFEGTAWSQAAAHTTKLLQSATAHPWQSHPLGNFTVPATQLPGMKCSGSATNNETDKTASESLDCSMQTGIHLNDGIRPGHLAVSHTLYRNKTYAPPRFSRFLQDKFGRAANDTRMSKYFAPMRCMDRIVALQGGRFKLVLCTAAYRRHPALGDALLRLMSLTDSQEALITTLNMGGVAPAAVLPYIEKFLAGFAWKPR